MTWQPELDELRARERMAREMGGPDKVQRQHDGGRLTVRERIDRLIDQGSFHEIGAIAGKAEYDADNKLTKLTPSNCVMGRAKIDGRPVIVLGDDFTVRGGSADATIPMKPILAERMANELRLPIIRIIEGSGGGGSVKTIETTGRANLPGQLGISSVRLPVPRRQPRHRAGGGAGARLGGGPRRGAAGGQPLLDHDQDHVGHVRGGAAGGGARRPEPQQAGAGRLGGAVPGRRRRPRGGDRGGGVPMRAPLPVVSALLGPQRAGAGRAHRSRRPARGEAVLGDPARPPQGLQDAADHRRRRRQGLVLRDGPDVRPPDHHRPGAARRAARGHPRQRSLSLRRRLDGGCLRQDRALRRHGRDVPSAGGLSVRLSRAS